jgi:hypothetical protein
VRELESLKCPTSLARSTKQGCQSSLNTRSPVSPTLSHVNTGRQTLIAALATRESGTCSLSIYYLTSHRRPKFARSIAQKDLSPSLFVFCSPLNFAQLCRLEPNIDSAMPSPHCRLGLLSRGLPKSTKFCASAPWWHSNRRVTYLSVPRRQDIRDCGLICPTGYSAVSCCAYLSIADLTVFIVT